MPHLFDRWRILRRPGLRGKAFALSAAIVCAWLVAKPVVRAQTITRLTTVHKFGGNDAGGSDAALLQAADGNFYGTIFDGGSGGYGAIFRMTPAGVLTVLHSFDPYADSTTTPETALIQGKDGALYGTTFGYFNSFSEIVANASIYKITTDGVFTLLHSFDSVAQVSALTQGSDGNFYGTSASGTSFNYGAVFKITPDGVFTVLHNFTNGDDGGRPLGEWSWQTTATSTGRPQVTRTSRQPSPPNGTIYQLTPAGGFTTIYRFTGGSDGAYPDTPLIQGSDGRLYGVDDYYVPQQGPGAYRETSTFFAVTTGGVFSILATVPAGTVTGLIQASDSNFYGTTRYFGADNVGSVFELTRDGTFTTLYSFAPGAEGFAGLATLIEGSDGGLYGATFGAMSTGDGTIFRLTFEAAPSAFFHRRRVGRCQRVLPGLRRWTLFRELHLFRGPAFFLSL